MKLNKIYHGDCLEVLKTFEDNSMDSVVTDPPYGLSMMGKKWDYSVPSIETWTEVLRVLKPGGHALVACGTKTQHRMAVNLEDAGFEIRDIIAWVYGSGFPKSLNIGKEVDKIQGNKREDITRNNSSFDGWGTGLKPAMELWTLCRKPIEEKNIAANVLKYGTGGININACRIPLNNEKPPTGSAKRIYKSNNYTDEKIYGDNKQTPEQGRFPANFIHNNSEELLKLFPNTKTGGGDLNSTGKTDLFTGFGNTNKPRVFLANSGSAARFFYCAKASPSERKDNNHPTVKPLALMRYLCKLVTPKNGVILDPFAGSGSTLVAANEEDLNFIGIEINQEYIEIAEKRIENVQTIL